MFSRTDSLKRLIDVAASLTLLTALLLPMLAIAFWIRCDSPGEALFRQLRVGRHGKPFRILKFRTMRQSSMPGQLITIAGDSRITRFGSFLRHWKLDELPQLVNILVGQMSLVGPRPEVAKYADLYPAKDRDLILSVRPGLTDLASIEYRDEAALLSKAQDPELFYTTEILPRKIRLYSKYVQEKSLALDFKILLRTIRALFN